jgi:hypothetical protein
MAGDGARQSRALARDRGLAPKRGRWAELIDQCARLAEALKCSATEYKDKK